MMKVVPRDYAARYNRPQGLGRPGDIGLGQLQSP